MTNMTTSIDAPSNATPALVLERWNSWVRVFLPATQETRWVDLQKHSYAPTDEDYGDDEGS